MRHVTTTRASRLVLLFTAGLADAYIASKPDRDEHAENDMSSIRSEFALTVKMADALAREDDSFAQPDILRKLIPIGFPLKNIRSNAVALLKDAAGLSIGFNASDGD